MPLFQAGVTEFANDREVAELTEALCLVAFFQEQALTFVAPCLKVVWIRAVFNKANRTAFSLHHVAADD